MLAGQNVIKFDLISFNGSRTGFDLLLKTPISINDAEDDRAMKKKKKAKPAAVTAGSLVVDLCSSHHSGAPPILYARSES